MWSWGGDPSERVRRSGREMGVGCVSRSGVGRGVRTWRVVVILNRESPEQRIPGSTDLFGYTIMCTLLGTISVIILYHTDSEPKQ